MLNLTNLVLSKIICLIHTNVQIISLQSHQSYSNIRLPSRDQLCKIYLIKYRFPRESIALTVMTLALLKYIALQRDPWINQTKRWKLVKVPYSVFLWVPVCLERILIPNPRERSSVKLFSQLLVFSPDCSSRVVVRWTSVHVVVEFLQNLNPHLDGEKTLLKRNKKSKIHQFILNPLSGKHEYIRHDTVVTSDSCNSGQNQNYDYFCVRAWNFLQNDIKKNFGWSSPEKLRYKVKFSMFFFKKDQKRLWHLKG